MFDYTPEADLDWFRSMMEEMNPGTEAGMKKKTKKVREKRPPARVSQSRRPHSRKRESRHRVSG